jgi:hypothetical protein
LSDDRYPTSRKGFPGFLLHTWYFVRRRDNWYRDVWLAFVSAFLLLALYNQNSVVTKVQDGRRLGTTITCAATSAVIEAGRTTLKNSATIKPRELEINLMRLGLPRQKARELAANAAASAYARHISQAVADQAGRTGKNVVRKDGTLDCVALRHAVGAD